MIKGCIFEFYLKLERDQWTFATRVEIEHGGDKNSD